MSSTMTPVFRDPPSVPAIPVAGRTLGQRAHRAGRTGRMKALLLVAPLFLYLLFSFLWPIAGLLVRAFDNRAVVDAFSHTIVALQAWGGDGMPPEAAAQALALDVKGLTDQQNAEASRRLNFLLPGYRTLLNKTRRSTAILDPVTLAGLGSIDRLWLTPAPWTALKASSSRVTGLYMLRALDLQQDAHGSIRKVSNPLFVDVILRTLGISFSVMLICLALGFCLAYGIASAEPAIARWLMLLLLLPFWISLLVRTTAWIVLLQGSGVINSILMRLGLIEAPLELMHNRAGVLIAMTHILLPFMVLPILAVMKRISPVYMRAAMSLGAPPWKAFLTVYVPQTLPGVGAGCMLVFVLALGYYITPALVGGPKDQMLSYFIAYFVNESSNWGMAAALSVVLLAIVLSIYALLATMLRSGRLRMR